MVDFADKNFQTVQKKANAVNESPVQKKGVSAAEYLKPVQAKAENNTGLPDNIKSGVENLSGISLSDVKVHYNSSKPAQMKSLAYTQGTDIHVAPGQQQHLAHEAWHVVQQKQGRVAPTTQMKGLNVNDSPALEHEADVMGAKAVQMKAAPGSPVQMKQQTGAGTIQCVRRGKTLKAEGKHANDLRIFRKAIVKISEESGEDQLKKTNEFLATRNHFTIAEYNAACQLAEEGSVKAEHMGFWRRSEVEGFFNSFISDNEAVYQALNQAYETLPAGVRLQLSFLLSFKEEVAHTNNELAKQFATLYGNRYLVQNGNFSNQSITRRMFDDTVSQETIERINDGDYTPEKKTQNLWIIGFFKRLANLIFLGNGQLGTDNTPMHYLADLMANGGRTQIDIPANDMMGGNAVMSYLFGNLWDGRAIKLGSVHGEGERNGFDTDGESPIFNRYAGTHYVTGKLEEKKGGKAFVRSLRPFNRYHHYGINVPMGGLGNVQRNTGEIIESNGRFGHLYLGVRLPSDSEPGSLLIGLESDCPPKFIPGIFNRPGATNPYGHSHMRSALPAQIKGGGGIATPAKKVVVQEQYAFQAVGMLNNLANNVLEDQVRDLLVNNGVTQ